MALEEGGTQPHLFAISDAGSSALRIVPDLHVGETTDGELTFDAENSKHRWLAFRGDDAGFWVEAATDGIHLTSVVGGLKERQPLFPGLVLAFPHNRLLVSQDSLAHPLPGPVVTVESTQRDDAEQVFLALDTNTDTGPGSTEPATVASVKRSGYPERSAPSRFLVFGVALVLLAIGATWLTISVLTDGEPPLLDAPVADQLASEAEPPMPPVFPKVDVQPEAVDSTPTGLAALSEVSPAPEPEVIQPDTTAAKALVSESETPALQVTAEDNVQLQTVDSTPTGLAARSEVSPAPEPEVIASDAPVEKVLISEAATPAPQVAADDNMQPQAVDSTPTGLAAPSEVSEATEPEVIPQGPPVTVGSDSGPEGPALQVASRDDVQPGLDSTQRASPAELGREDRIATLETAAEEKISIAASMLFPFDSAVLSDDAKAVIDEHIQRLAEQARLTVITRIEGHTDTSGPELYNLYLSQRRAQIVANYIVSQADSELVSDMEVIGKGGTEPVASNDSREGRVQNRRVEIYVTGKPEI